MSGILILGGIASPGGSVVYPWVRVSVCSVLQPILDLCHVVVPVQGPPGWSCVGSQWEFVWVTGDEADEGPCSQVGRVVTGMWIVLVTMFVPVVMLIFSHRLVTHFFLFS